jgi:hypothetical protein
MMVVMMLLTLAFVGILVVSSVTLSQIRLSARGQGRAATLALAESGLDDAVERLQSVSIDYGGTVSDSAYISTAGWVTLYDDFPLNTAVAGKYRTVVEPLTGQRWKRKITSVGRTDRGDEVTVYAIADIQTRRIGSAAILANGPVQVSGTAIVGTVPMDLHIAHVMANGNISMGGSSFVDGYLSSHGTVVGTAYYPSESGAPEIIFPDWATTEQWRNEYRTQATGPGATTINANSLNFKNGPITITAPAYIQGNLNLQNSETLIFTGGSEKVVYLDGDVKMTGTCSITNGVTFVVRGRFEQGGNTVYKIDPTVTPTPALVVYGLTSSSGTAASSGTITTTLAGTTGTDSAGIVWTISGSLKVSGGSNFTGALVVSQSGSGVSVNGNYNHYYPEGLGMTREMPPVVTLSAIVEP